MIDVKHLRSFCVLAETLHFGRAADRLNLSQPPLSRQIAALERELGVELFKRSSRSVALTAAGTQLHADTKAILALLEQARKNATAAQRGEVGSLRIGFTSCAAYNVVPGIVRTYTSAFPAVRFTIREHLPDELDAKLMEGRIDAAIMFPPERDHALNLRTVYTEPLCAALPEGHQLARKRKIDICELAHTPFVIAPRSAAPSLYDVIIGHCRAGGFKPRVHIETHLQQTILNLVAEGVGVALVPRSMMKARLSGAVFRPLQNAPLVRQVIAWPKREINPCLQGFLGLLPSPPNTRQKIK